MISLLKLNLRKSVIRDCACVGLIGMFVITMSYGQNGRVGINTANPLAVLHVADSSVVFTKSSFGSQSGSHPPVTGAGNRMMWFPPRSAFRVGGVSDMQWSRDSIGVYSIATGENTVAFGSWSFAHGYESRALGNYSIAMGSNCRATLPGSIALGNGTRATGSNSVAMGTLTKAANFNSFAIGSNTEANGQNSFATGIGTKANGTWAAAFGNATIAQGNAAASFGFNTTAGPYASFAIGRYNTLFNISTLSWLSPDPVFMIGNGDSLASPRNAMTVLKNGNVGLFTSQPTFRFHVTNDNFNDGGFQQGIMIENTNLTPGEAAISFRNKSIPGNRQWILGINETPPHFSFAYGTSFTTTNTHMMIDTTGRVGINTTTPQAQLHVVYNNPSGGNFSNNAIAIFESNNSSYIQLSNENTDETGILSGNQATLIRSALVFAADSSIDLRAGGNGTDLKISTEGNIGIGIYTPSAKLHVNGTSKLGVNGTTITEIIKATVNANVPNVPANGGTVAHLFTITNAALTSAVSVSQNGSLAAGLVIASARVSSADDMNNVEVRFVNTSGADINPPAMDYYFTVIR